ncbi:putative cyclin-A3-1 [Neltuma alba]|uniref:putative cyclin-A3-1 n=1 Tax=Neltuma alba TaxID=207710 RepID=UPI0010A2D22C|nr:putative cyclin-A3-1 [Prosopis alba]
METRAAKKRAEADAIAQHESSNKRRVVLGELSNLPNAIFPAILNQKCRKKTLSLDHDADIKDNKAAPVDSKSDADANLNDQQKIDPPASQIYQYLHKMEMEPKRRPMPDYLEKVQKNVSANARGILINWLAEVAEEYRLLSDTLHLSVSYIDRFLSAKTVSKQRLQLLGVSSMFIASKYEEISPPRVEDFCYITDNTYTQAEVVEMEAHVLKYLNFEMGSPTVKTFLRRLAGIASEYQKTHKLQFEFLAYYLGELSLLDYNCVKFLQSMVAASAIFLARFIIWPKVHPWNSALQGYSGYKPHDLKQCVLILHDLYLARKAGFLQAIREKYRQHKFKNVATLPSPPEIPDTYFDKW